MAIICIFLYVIGVPLTQFLVLWHNRKDLHEDSALDLKAHRKIKKEFGAIYEHYTEECYYYDLVDLIRRLLLTGGLILVGGSSVAQVLLGVTICLAWLLLVSFKRPYRAYWDNILSMVLSLHLLFTLISGMALKMYRMGETDDTYEQILFDWMLVLMTVLCMLLGVFALIITIPCLRNRITNCKNRRKKKENPKKIIMEWTEKQKTLVKWLSSKQLKELLQEVETKMEKKVAEVLSPEKVYPGSILERMKKININFANIARIKMLAQSKRKRRFKMKRKLLPMAPNAEEIQANASVVARQKRNEIQKEKEEKARKLKEKLARRKRNAGTGSSNNNTTS